MEGASGNPTPCGGRRRRRAGNGRGPNPPAGPASRGSWCLFPSPATFSASGWATGRVALAQLVQELVGRHVERVFLVDAANDHRRMHAQGVHDDRGSEARKVVVAADGIVVLVEGVVA